MTLFSGNSKDKLMSSGKKMSKQDVRANSAAIYERFKIMPNLALHMRRVAAVADFIADHWSGPSLDRDLLVAAALTHDLGNIAKAKLDSEHQKELMGDEFNRLDYWRRVKSEIISKYGANEFEVTRAMLGELGADEEIFKLISHAGFRHNVETALVDDWHRKVLAHADHVVAPHGVVSLDERLSDGRRRYGYDEETDRKRPEVLAAYDIAQQVAEHLDVPIESINEESVQPYLQRLC
jgi:hypothetical protein